MFDAEFHFTDFAGGEVPGFKSKGGSENRFCLLMHMCIFVLLFCF